MRNEPSSIEVNGFVCTDSRYCDCYLLMKLVGFFLFVWHANQRWQSIFFVSTLYRHISNLIASIWLSTWQCGFDDRVFRTVARYDAQFSDGLFFCVRLKPFDVFYIVKCFYTGNQYEQIFVQSVFMLAQHDWHLICVLHFPMRTHFDDGVVSSLALFFVLS